jgi:hypothetical protein
LRKLSRKRNFSRNEISRKLPHFRMIFAFRENEKKPFSFQPYRVRSLMFGLPVYAVSVWMTIDQSTQSHVWIGCLLYAASCLDDQSTQSHVWIGCPVYAVSCLDDHCRHVLCLDAQSTQ